MPGAGGADDAGVLVDPPIHLADAPAAVQIPERGVDDAGQAHLDRKGANRMDHRGESNGGRKVGRGEDSDGVLVHARHEGALNAQSPVDGDGLRKGSGGARVEDVLDGAQVAVAAGGQVTGQQVGERKGVGAALEGIGLGQELPGEERGHLAGAFGAILDDRLAVGGSGVEVHGEGLQGDVRVGHSQ